MKVYQPLLPMRGVQGATRGRPVLRVDKGVIQRLVRVERVVLVGLGGPEMTGVMEVTEETMVRMVPMVRMGRPEVAVIMAQLVTVVADLVRTRIQPNPGTRVRRGRVGILVETGASTGMRVDLYTLKTIS